MSDDKNIAPLAKNANDAIFGQFAQRLGEKFVLIDEIVTIYDFTSQLYHYRNYNRGMPLERGLIYGL